MILLIMIKDNKTQYHLCSSSCYDVGQTTSNGWYVIYKGFYYKGCFKSYEELKYEYWELYSIRAKELRNKRNSLFSRLFK